MMLHRRVLAALAFTAIALSPAFAERLELTVANAQQAFDPQTTQPIISITLDEESRQAFADFTAASVGKIADFYVGDEIMVSPTINEPITGGELQISGSFTAEEATELGVNLARGDVPISVESRD
ncbi:SecDF P1 head subdomain-containing protein [Aliihoeflea sp. PC F10.4]